jgi:hypothetical protein
MFWVATAPAQQGHNHSPTMTHLVFAESKLHAHVTWEKGPLLGEESIISVEWRDFNHAPAQPKKAFEVVLWMPEMGHGSAPTVIEPVKDASGKPVVGAYRVSNVFFIMGGLWQVIIHLQKEDETKESQTLEVKIADEADHHHHH